MEIPAKVMVHNPILGVKGQAGSLIAVSKDGYYEIHMPLGNNTHTILFPISETVLVCQTPNPEIGLVEIER